MRTLAERERRLARARVASRIEIGLGTVAVMLPVLWLIGALTSNPVYVSGTALEFVAYAGIVGGFLWMVRIRFTGPEDGARSNWRSH